MAHEQGQVTGVRVILGSRWSMDRNFYNRNKRGGLGGPLALLFVPCATLGLQETGGIFIMRLGNNARGGCKPGWDHHLDRHECSVRIFVLGNEAEIPAAVPIIFFWISVKSLHAKGRLLSTFLGKALHELLSMNQRSRSRYRADGGDV
jgi:hypothetical protein